MFFGRRSAPTTYAHLMWNRFSWAHMENLFGWHNYHRFDEQLLNFNEVYGRSISMLVKFWMDSTVNRFLTLQSRIVSRPLDKSIYVAVDCIKSWKSSSLMLISNMVAWCLGVHITITDILLLLSDVWIANNTIFVVLTTGRRSGCIKIYPLLLTIKAYPFTPTW